MGKAAMCKRWQCAGGCEVWEAKVGQRGRQPRLELRQRERSVNAEGESNALKQGQI